VFPRDAPWHWPAQGSAHRVQKRVAAKAAKRSLASVAGDIATETGVCLGTRQSEQIVCAAAQDFEAFYEQPCPEAVQRQAAATPMLGLTCDGKGVGMRQEALREATRQRAEASGPQVPQGLQRQDQSHRTRMATVAGLSPIDRPGRTPQTVAQQCAPLRLVPHPRRAAPKPVGTKRWARLEKSMNTVSDTGFADGQRRAPQHRAAWGVLVDGDLTQIDDIEQAARALGGSVVLIVDLMHGLA